MRTTGVRPTVPRMSLYLAIAAPRPSRPLHVQNTSVRIEHRFLHHLRQSRMREDSVHQFLFRRLEGHRDDIALDQFGDLCADHMGAEKLPGLLVEDDLLQPLVLPKRDRLAVADEGEAADADVELLLLRGLLGEADGGNLRRTIRAARDHRLVHRMRVETLDRIDADDALVLGLVREHRRAGDVADGVNAGHVRPAQAVGDDDAALGLHAKLLEAEILDIADDADGGDDAVYRDLLRLAVGFDRRGDAVRLLFELRHLGAGHDLDALFLEALAGKCLNLVVFDGQYLRQHFDDRHLGSEGAVERSELDADGAGADDEQRLRNRRRHLRLEIGPALLLGGLEPRLHARPRAGRDDDVLGLV